MANNISTANLPEVISLNNDDDIIVNSNKATSRIKVANFIKKMGGDWSSVINKPFDVIDSNCLVPKILDDNETKQLTFADSVIVALNKAHSHDNADVIGLFSESNGELLWNNESIQTEIPIATISVAGIVKPDGSTITIDADGTIHGANTYELPVASHTTLGGVKVDGTSITINPEGVISAVVESGLDFTELATAMTTGIQHGITVTADTLNKRFNFEVTGIPTIAIDSEGYWTFDGDRGANPTKAQGEKGENGVSPAANITQTETGATITVTDETGTTSAQISNGSDGISPHIDAATGHWFVGETDTGVNATASIDDTSVDGTDVTWSANKINSMIGDINTILASVVGGGA